MSYVFLAGFFQYENKSHLKSRKGHDGAEGKDSVAYNALLKNEILGAHDDFKELPEERRALSPVHSPNLYKVSLKKKFFIF